MTLAPRINDREVTASKESLDTELAQYAAVYGLRQHVEQLRKAQKYAEELFETESRKAARSLFPEQGYQFVIRFEPGEEMTRGTYREYDRTKFYKTALIDSSTQIVDEHTGFIADMLQYDDMGQIIAVSPDRAQACLVPVTTNTSSGPRIFGVAMERTE